jgi:hypothetical protein
VNRITEFLSSFLSILPPSIRPTLATFSLAHDRPEMFQGKTGCPVKVSSRISATEDKDLIFPESFDP